MYRDELRDTVDAGFIDLDTVKGYIERLNAPQGRVDFKLFTKFMAMMDHILGMYDVCIACVYM